VSRLARYLLWQAPGWVIVAAVVATICWLGQLPAWLVWLGVAAAVIKDLVMYRAFRDTLRPPPGLVGARGRAVERLGPAGYVRVDGELWRAEAVDGEIAAGTEVVVREARGLTLRVDVVERP
jgi:membrane protein implicated in regulation of membrane protease activity